MPSISKIRLTNVVYEEGNKRYNDELFLFDGHNGAILLENGGGKTVFIQTAIQAILPHEDLANRKIKNTLMLENAPAHIAIEWITNDNPRRYVVTAVSLFMTKHGLDSLRYVYEYDAHDPNGIDGIPFVRDGKEGKRTAERGEMQDYYGNMRDKTFHARTFHTIKDYRGYIEEQYHIIANEWENIVKINGSEGGVEAFFDECKSVNQLFDRLLIPTVENSIVGHDATIFADMFEQQHASFKNYKKLKETIEEMKQIEAELVDYVGTFENLHLKEQIYEKTKQKAKGYLLVTINQKEKATKEFEDAKLSLQQWEEEQYAFKVKESSYDILLEKTKFETLDKEYKEVLATHSDKKEALSKQQKGYYSLKFASLRDEKEKQVEQLNFINQEIEKFSKTEERINYEEDLEETKRSLLGHFMEEIEKIEKEKQGLGYELSPIQSQLIDSQKQRDDLVSTERNLRDQLSKVSAKVENRLKDIKTLEQQILGNPIQENVRLELPKWTERQQFLDEEIIRLQQQLKQLSIDEKEANERKEQFESESAIVERQIEKIGYQLKDIDNSQINLINRLSLFRSEWASVEDVYLVEETIKHRIIERIEKLSKERNHLLYNERIAYRLVDDHENQAMFFGDTFLEQQVSSWKNQFDYLVTGVEYLESMSVNERIAKKSYPLWPLTLVTTNKSKQQVIEKLKHIADRIQFPIIVVTTEEAVEIKENSFSDSWVAPKFWHDNMDLEFFNKWKAQVREKAEVITKDRIDKENEVKSWEELLNAFQTFLDQYPFEVVEALKSALTESKNHQENLKVQIGNERRFIEETKSKMSVMNGNIYNYQNEKQGYETRIEKGMLHQQYVQEIEEEQRKENNIKETHENVLKKLTRIDQQLERIASDKSDLESRIQKLSFELQQIHVDDDYQMVVGLTPVFSGQNKRIIKDRMLELEYKIRQIDRTHGEWLEKRNAADQAIKSLSNQMDSLKNEHPYIDTDMNLPVDAKHLIQSIWDKITILKDELEVLSAELQKRAKHKNTQEGKLNTKIEQFHVNHPEFDIVTFSHPLEMIKDDLLKEQHELTDRKKYISQQTERINKNLGDIDEAIRGLDRFVEGHHFNAPDIDATYLSAEEVTEYNYQRKKIVKAITDELTSNKEIVEAEKYGLDRARRRFRDFCSSKITDIKLQQMAINGVETKLTFSDIISFKNNMMVRIENISKYANEHIRKSDEDLQLFINQIHTHLLTLVEELKQIPKKTRVKVMDDWKQIFTFTIPEWEEEVGKTRIRDHIEWILKQLETERFQNDQGYEDEGKVRKEVEMWLQSKQLLQIIMNNEVMKVSCRKVTNDNKVTTRSYSWEQSNVWSGGEKWSKNMTLFLGILNYVAEKKHHIQPNMKHHRSVILDNPFGKASSDHVLSPVFFVAEQLGFQIIALTAHAEGKFLQDYFPVIYSCRLRPSVDPNKKVMTKEKWLHHAYFQDHEPKTIERLGEVEQLALFE